MALTKVTDSIIDFDTLTIAGTQAADTTYLKLQNTPATAATHEVAMEFWGNEGTANGSSFNIGKIYGHFDGSTYATTRLTLGSASGSGTFNDEINLRNGNVGLGTGDPGAHLHISKTTPTIRMSDGGASNSDSYIQVSGGDLKFYADDNQADGNTKITFTLDGSQMALMDDAKGFTVSATDTPIQNFYNGVGSATGWGGNIAGYLATVRGGTSTPFYVSHSSTGSGEFIHFLQNTTSRGTISYNGSVMVYGGTSDYRLKENVVDLPNATTRLNALRPVNFDWIDTGDNSEGFLAHEVQAQVPYAVQGTHNEVYTEDGVGEEQADLVGQPKYQQVDYGKLTPLLVKALQESNAKIEALETRIETLENA